jgi:hypothetical protein
LVRLNAIVLSIISWLLAIDGNRNYRYNIAEIASLYNLRIDESEVFNSGYVNALEETVQFAVMFVSGPDLRHHVI